MAQLNFNASQHAPSAPAGAMPVGWYTAKIVESEVKPNSKANGTYLALTFEIIAPAQFAGRKQWTNLNTNHPNEKAVEIAYADLSAICHAINTIQFADTNELHNKPLDIKVGMQKPERDASGNIIDGQEPRNELKGYRACEGVAGAQAPAMGGAQMGQQAPANPMMQQAAQQPMQQAAQQPQQPWNQPAQQPVQQQQNWNQPAQQPAQQAAQQPAQQAAQQPMQQAEQPAWAAQQPVQQAAQQPVQQVAQQAAQQPVQTQIQQPATDPNAQAAAAAGTPPWAQQPQG